MFWHGAAGAEVEEVAAAVEEASEAATWVEAATWAQLRPPGAVIGEELVTWVQPPPGAVIGEEVVIRA